MTYIPFLHVKKMDVMSDHELHMYASCSYMFQKNGLRSSLRRWYTYICMYVCNIMYYERYIKIISLQTHTINTDSDTNCIYTDF